MNTRKTSHDSRKKPPQTVGAPIGRSAFAAVAVLLALLTTACTQRVPDEQVKPKLFAATAPTGSLGVEYRSEVDKQTVDGTETKTDSKLLEEFLELNTDGYIFHPNFVQFVAGATFGLSQEDYSENDRSVSNNGKIQNYDLSADVLKQKRYPMHFYATRSDELVARQFAPSLRLKRSTEGGSIRWLSEIAPMQFSFSHNAYVEEQQDPLFDSISSSTWNFAFSGSLDLDRRGTFTYNYSHTVTPKDSLSPQLTTDSLELGHDIYFDKKERYKLSTDLLYLQETGSPSFTDIDLTTLLELEHTDSFSTWYRLTSNQRKARGDSQEVLEGQAGLRHQLYESLTTTAQAGAAKDSTGSLTTTREGGRLGFDYRKRNRAGTLYAGVGYDYQHTLNSGASVTLLVINEIHYLSDAVPSFLEHDYVERSSIVVTNDAGTETYTENLDYTVSQVGTRYQLFRIATGGRITENQKVKVDYEYTRQGNNQLDTLNQNYYLRQRFFFGLTPYIQFNRRDETVTPSTADLIENDHRIFTIGAEQKLGPFTFSAERKDAESTVSPYRQARYAARYQMRMPRKMRLSLDMDYTDIDYRLPTSAVQIFRSTMTLDRQFTKSLLLNASAEYRDEEDSITGSTTALVGRLGLFYRFRAFRFNTSVEQSWVTTRTGPHDNTLVLFRLERLF